MKTIHQDTRIGKQKGLPTVLHVVIHKMPLYTVHVSFIAKKFTLSSTVYEIISKCQVMFRNRLKVVLPGRVSTSLRCPAEDGGELSH